MKFRKTNQVLGHTENIVNSKSIKNTSQIVKGKNSSKKLLNQK